MPHQHIIFVPGKNPKPVPEQHRSLLWHTLLEGVRRVAPATYNSLVLKSDCFQLTAWNHDYYNCYKNANQDRLWIDKLISQDKANSADIREANNTNYKLMRLLYQVIDYFPFLLKFMPARLKSTAQEISRYFKNKNNIACEIREKLKQQLRPILNNNEKVLLIGHSLGSVIAYDTLWELSHIEKLPGRVDMLLTLGSPLGMNYVQHRLAGNQFTATKKYPDIIDNWVNISAEGDITALDQNFSDDFKEMIELGLIKSIEDHCDGIYNYFRNEEGLNVHRSYGYLVNPVVGKVIADWWQEQSDISPHE